MEDIELLSYLQITLHCDFEMNGSHRRSLKKLMCD